MNRLIALALAVVFLTACTTARTPLATPIPPTGTPAPPASTKTETPISLIDLTGALFFDYNGSGLWDKGEPPIPGYGLCAKRIIGDWACTVTDKKGYFVFNNISPKDEDILLMFEKTGSEITAETFRYINIWHSSVVIETYDSNNIQVPEQHLNDTEVLPIESVIKVEVGKENKLGLMQGFLTMPINCSSNYSIGSWYDLDPRLGYIANWQGDKQFLQRPINFDKTIDQNDGVSFVTLEDQYVYASAPGSICYSGADPPTDVDLPAAIAICHFGQYTSSYRNLDQYAVELGQEVMRGQIIATMKTPTKASEYLNWSIQVHSYKAIHNPFHQSTSFDPYRDLNDPGTLSYWTLDNNPQCLP